MDFFKKNPQGGYFHNFTTIAFYQTGYNLFTLRQSAARHWRIGQSEDCRVYYLHYAGTMQARAMELIARKMYAASQLDGDLSVEGLVSMSDEQSSAMALARSISENLADTDISRNWSKIGAAQVKAKTIPFKSVVETGRKAIAEIPLDDLDLLSMPAAMIAQSLIENSNGLTRGQAAKMFDDFFGMDVDDMAELLAAY